MEEEEGGDSMAATCVITCEIVGGNVSQAVDLALLNGTKDLGQI